MDTLSTISHEGKIGILCRRPRDFHIFEKMARALHNAEFILVPTFAPETFLGTYKNMALDQYRLTKEFLSSKNIPWRAGPENFLAGDLQNLHSFFDNYELLIDTHNSFFMLHPATINKKKVLYMYDDVITGFWPNTSFFNIDLVLTMGPYFNNILTPFIKTVEIGSLYLDEVDGSPPHPSFLKLERNKKTILYLPQEELFKSPASFSGAINELSNHYNVIVQLTQEAIAAKKNINLFSLNKKINILDEAQDVRLLSPIVNLVVTDDSLKALEWLALVKPVIFLDLWTKDFFIQNQSHFPSAPQNLSDNFYTAHDAEELKSLAEETIAKTPASAPSRLDDFFYMDKKEPAYLKAAEAIIKVLEKERRPSSSFSTLVFKPGDIAIQNYNFYYMLRPFFHTISDIINETSFVKKCLKIIKTFFG